jgi:hypothetical protein
LHMIDSKMIPRMQVDPTYKTNPNGMPLLNVVGVTAAFNSCNADFVDQSLECEEVEFWDREGIPNRPPYTKVYPKS